ncbi:PAS domain-containing protein [Marivibrio halodurans]|uniref:PAS domain-containing protein n=1 Tax=Marivibrio halodurans TaxID=2039722 RepID=A0A8J7S7A6_9PROT|nr:PAS domain-containing protein [Marivibrio halodurans]MBP5856882.1 PAS domain-containing protein [Marivibrio halodurans]
MSERVDDLEGTLAEPAFAIAREVFEYWRECVPGRDSMLVPPDRAAIDPLLDIPQAAPYLTLLDIEKGEDGRPHDYFFRLVGTRIVDFEGECTGRRLSDMMPRSQFPNAWAQYEDAVAGRLWIRIETLDWQDRGHMRYSSLFMPLRRGGRSVEMLLGVHYSEAASNIGRPAISTMTTRPVDTLPPRRE